MNDKELYRFLEKADIQPYSCWNWKGAKIHHGYGQFHYKGRTRLAHQVIYEHVHGTVPAGLVIKHRCHNPSCVNPTHLEAGTQASNIQEAVALGWRPPRGLRHGKVIVTKELVEAIFLLRAKGESTSAIADYYGIGETTVRTVLRGESWVQLEAAGIRYP